MSIGLGSFIYKKKKLVHFNIQKFVKRNQNSKACEPW